MRVVHYLNQFFGGRGGEEAAHLAPHLQDGAVGPGRLLEQVLGAGAQVVRTIVVGDNYAAEHVESLSALVEDPDGTLQLLAHTGETITSLPARMCRQTPQGLPQAA